VSKQQLKVRIASGSLGGVTLLFVGLKLTGYIAFRWLWLTSGLWTPLVLAGMLLILAGLLSAVVDIEAS
jgi:hypothetical protein